jgi:hypothetical protein
MMRRSLWAAIVAAMTTATKPTTVRSASASEGQAETEAPVPGTEARTPLWVFAVLAGWALVALAFLLIALGPRS